MPKYYVSSGDFNRIIEGVDPKTAACDAFESLKDFSPMHLGIITIVSERGFDSIADDDVLFPTLDLLEETDQLENFRLEDWL